MSQGKFGGGEGTLNNPYLIEDVEDLNAIRFYPTKNFKLTQDINLGVYPYNTNKGWLPINDFCGTLDGDGHSILNMYINRPNQDAVGFIGSTAMTVNVVFQIKNLFIKNCNIIGHNSVAPICGHLNATQSQTEPYVENCKITGKVLGNEALSAVFGGIKCATAVTSANIINNSYLKVDMSLSAQGTNYGMFVAYDAVNNANYTISNVISLCTFDNSVNGIPTVLAPNFCSLYTGMKYTNVYFNTDLWKYGVTTANGAKGLNSEEITNRLNLGTLYQEANDNDELLWDFKTGEREPQLKLFFYKKYLIKCDKGYYVYSNTNGWTKVLDKIKTNSKVFEMAMEGIDHIPFSAWEEFKNKVSVKAKIIVLIPDTNGTIQIQNALILDKDLTIKDNLVRKYDGLETKVFRRKISFQDKISGDTIVKIAKQN